MNSATETEIIAVFDALYEAAVVNPTIAHDGPHAIQPSALVAAMAVIPDEHHTPGTTVGHRFVSSVITNARAVNRSPYTVAMFALDIS